jgi:hypothetical protein
MVMGGIVEAIEAQKLFFSSIYRTSHRDGDPLVRLGPHASIQGPVLQLKTYWTSLDSALLSPSLRLHLLLRHKIPSELNLYDLEPVPP